MYFDIIFYTLFLAFIIIIGWVENNDMKQINDQFMKTNWNDPLQAFQYLHLVQTKPQWRICLIAGSLMCFGLMAIVYGMLKDKDDIKIDNKLFFLCLLAIAFIGMNGYLSFFAFHVLVPNGGQDNYHKLKYSDCKNLCTMFG